MDIKIGLKLHNYFDIEVKDVITGEIVQRGKAENIVLNEYFNRLLVSSSINQPTREIAYGSGTGTLGVTRKTLFTRVGSKSATIVSKDYNLLTNVFSVVKKVVLTPTEHVGVTFTEVGFQNYATTDMTTHALIKDSEGNPVSIGPKTDTQEITFYGTVFAELTFESGVLPVVLNHTITGLYNLLIEVILGNAETNNLTNTSNMYLSASGDKTPTVQLIENNNSWLRQGTSLLEKSGATFTGINVANKLGGSPRVRYGTADANNKIWSLEWYRRSATPSNPILRILLPAANYAGHQFLNKAIGTGNGVATEFSLPWNEINASKAKTWYIDGVATTATITENTALSTKIQFASPPANGAIITGDWWVDYIPKDSGHVLDATFRVQFGVPV